MEQDPAQAPKNNIWWIILIVIILIIIGIFVYYRLFNKSESQGSKSSKLEIPEKTLNNKYGWLSGGEKESIQQIIDSGGAWVRPHPGAFLWDSMQESASSSIDFSKTDEDILNYQTSELGILVTIWPFADWDQKNLKNASQCMVSENDEFLSKDDEKKGGYYLSRYRCNPNDWFLYQSWIEKIVERYDGDGIDDMPNLKIPVKYWEVLNEPDLNYNSNLSEDETSRLNFYKQGPVDYGTLLKQTYSSIKKADPESKVLIAGAAGGDTNMLSFYETLFMNVKDAPNYFDIGNVHCISNDEKTHDFNVAAYNKVLADAGINKPIWVTEAEAFYKDNTTANQNYESTKTSVAGAIAAGAKKIFFTRNSFENFKSDTSQKIPGKNYASTEEYKQIILENN